MYKNLDRINLHKIEKLAEISDYWKWCLNLVKRGLKHEKLSVNEQKWLRRIVKQHNEEYFKKINFDKYLK